MSPYGALELKAGYQKHLAGGLAFSVFIFVSLPVLFIRFGDQLPIAATPEERGRVKLIPFTRPKPAPPQPTAPAPRPPAPSQPNVGVFMPDSFLEFERFDRWEPPPFDSGSFDTVAGKETGNNVAGEAPVDLELEGLTPPEILHRVEPAYPAMARERGISETVTAELVVGKDGFVREVVILKGRTGVFDDPVCAALKKWIFKPLVFDGRAVSFRYLQTVTFRLSQ